MKYTKHRYILLFSLLQCAGLSAISMVYNFRIAQLTKQPIFENRHGRTHNLVGLVFDQYRKKRTGVKQQFVGGLGAFIYDFNPYYSRVDFGGAHIREKTKGTNTFAGTEADDILFTLGKDYRPTDFSVLTFSGLFGIPTHRIYRLQHTDFGYSQIGLGIQMDGSYTINETRGILYGARYIHFVPRTALDTTDTKHIFTLGNVGDILLAHKNAWGKNGLEFGYTFRARFGAQVCPNLDDVIEKTNYLRSNFYVVYKYRFLINEISNRLLFNISYGFDHRPKLFGNKYIVTLWGSWNVGF